MKLKKVTTILYVLIIIAYIFWFIALWDASAEPPKSRSKFYDFSEQVIDGHIKKPTALYTDSRQAVKFNRLLKLKKSFIPNILDSAKNPIFK
jgi:hypothetical protein|tara:strand:- start:1382 stop:1657 length:276 start_codon:yes stop_codon:yes gene_type:complete